MTGVVLLAILAVTALGAGGLFAVAASGASYDNVQISIQTAANLPYSYVVSAYNSSGSMVAYSQTNFPMAAFELPGGSYLFTVTAYHYEPYVCQVCVEPALGAKAPAASGTAIIAPPIQAPEVEYGYALQQVSGQESITIQTQNTTSIPTTNVSVRVTYANGTAAAGAYVSAFVVGQSYYYWSEGTSISMSGQTDSSGVAQLVVPSVPVEVDSSLSIPVILPQNETTVQTTIAGQKINVTVYWQPMYVTLSGSALIIPPQTGATIVLQYQPSTSYYYPAPYASSGSSGSGVASPGVPSTSPGAGSSTSTASNQAASSQGQSAPASRISPFTLGTASAASSQSSQATSAAHPATGMGDADLLLLALVAAVVVALAAVFIARARTKR